MILYVITILSLILCFFSVSLTMKYLYLYRNLRKNFKSFLDFVDKNYIRKNDVILHNATVDALDRAREKNHTFEIKAYMQLLQRIKE